MNGYDRQTLITTADLAAVAAFAYQGSWGIPRITPVTPLLLDGHPAFTLTYARAELAREISSSRQAALVFNDSRMAYVGWSPLIAGVEVEIIPDLEGELFREKLLHQELRKFPPDRQLIDSPLLQRENWWYLPRLVVRVTDAGDPRPVIRRQGPDDGVLVFESGGGLAAETVRVEDWESDRISLRPLAMETVLEDSPAALLCHDFATPDMDPRATILVTGLLENGRLTVRERQGSRRLGKRPGFVTRWWMHKELERRCKEGLRKHGSS